MAVFFSLFPPHPECCGSGLFKETTCWQQACSSLQTVLLSQGNFFRLTLLQFFPRSWFETGSTQINACNFVYCFFCFCFFFWIRAFVLRKRGSTLSVPLSVTNVTNKGTQMSPLERSITADLGLNSYAFANKCTVKLSPVGLMFFPFNYSWHLEVVFFLVFPFWKQIWAILSAGKH